MTIEEYSETIANDLTDIYVGFDHIVEDVIVKQIIEGDLTGARKSINDVSKGIKRYTSQVQKQQGKLIKRG